MEAVNRPENGKDEDGTGNSAEDVQVFDGVRKLDWSAVVVVVVVANGYRRRRQRLGRFHGDCDVVGDVEKSIVSGKKRQHVPFISLDVGTPVSTKDNK